MKQRASVIIQGIACLALGAAIQRVYDTWSTAARQTAKVAPAALGVGRHRAAGIRRAAGGAGCSRRTGKQRECPPQ